MNNDPFDPFDAVNELTAVLITNIGASAERIAARDLSPAIVQRALAQLARAPGFAILLNEIARAAATMPVDTPISEAPAESTSAEL